MLYLNEAISNSWILKHEIMKYTYQRIDLDVI